MNWKLLATAILFIPVSVFAQEWRLHAPLHVEKAGLVEVPLLPELHSQNADGLDLQLINPDGQPRPFELYWREQRGETTLNLKMESSRLEGMIFIWEAKVPEAYQKHKMKSLQINVLSADYIGHVDIFGKKDNQWLKIAGNYALYKAGQNTQGDVKIPEREFEEFRLEFTAFGKKPVPIGSVTVNAEMPGKDYLETEFPVSFQRKEINPVSGKKIAEMTANLPGSGIYIKDVTVTTLSQFNGSWIVERQAVSGGQRTFLAVAQGEVHGVQKGATSFKIDLGQTWPGNIINLRLTSADNYISPVKAILLTLRLPRLVFLADTPGTYLAQTGLNNKTRIMEYPSSRDRTAMSAIKFGQTKQNAQWKPESLIKSYQIGGAGFKPDGYEWVSNLNISEPGYYRFLLHRLASLEENLRGLRLVRNDIQVPYFMERGAVKEVPLRARETYDKKKNTSTWQIELPQASSRWYGLQLKSQGIFTRVLKVERDQPQPVQNTLWTSINWSNKTSGKTETFVSLTGFPRAETKIRLVMAHGDNKPIKIEEIKALYDAPAVYFLADAAGTYELYGGNPSAMPPSYDLELVHNQLMQLEPKMVDIAEPSALAEPSTSGRIFKTFSENNWGLYIVLGFLTLGLLFVIARLFPK